MVGNTKDTWYTEKYEANTHISKHIILSRIEIHSDNAE